MLYFLGEAAIKNQALMCVSDSYLVVHDNAGGAYMLFHTLTILIYSGAMWHIFYRVPRKHNLIAFQKFGTEKINAINIRATNSMRRIDEKLNEFIDYDKEEREFQSNVRSSKLNTEISNGMASKGKLENSQTSDGRPEADVGSLIIPKIPSEQS